MDDDVDTADDDNEEIDYETMVQYSIKFYYTPEFAAVTPDVEGFVSQVVTEINMGYINSEVPLEAYVLCTEEAEELTEEPDARAQLFNFARMTGRGHSALAAVREFEASDDGGDGGGVGDFGGGGAQARCCSLM